MSESEKRQRNGYRRNRDLWIFVHSAIIAVVTVSALIFGLVAHNLSKTYYIGYHERGSINYSVRLKPNDFYATTTLGPNQAYVASLIEGIDTFFNYQISMETDDVNYRYSYNVTSRLEIIDKTSNAPLFTKEKVEHEVHNQQQSSASTLYLENIHVPINYDEYNTIANEFMAAYDLSSVSSQIVVTMEVEVLSSCNAFTGSSTDTYTSELIIPLTQKTVNIEVTANTPPPESNFVACTRGMGSEVFKTTAIVLTVIDVMLILLLVAFIALTKTPDTTYNGRVKRLVAQYKSYIQKIQNAFDPDGYQIILVDTFTELLEIHDTLQAPILMYENEDKTCTKFLMPTNNHLLYQYSIFVEGYEDPTPDPKPKAEPTTIVKPHITNVVKPVVKVVMPTPPPPPPPAPEPEPDPEKPEIETIVEEPEIEVVSEEKLTPTVAVLPEEPAPEPAPIVIVVEEPKPEPQPEPEPEPQPEPESEPEPVIMVMPEPEVVTEVVEEVPVEVEVEVEVEEEVAEPAPIEEEDESDWTTTSQEPILIPTWDEATEEYVVHEADVATGDYKIELNYPIRNIIRVVRHGAEKAFTALITPDDVPAAPIADNKIHVELNRNRK